MSRSYRKIPIFGMTRKAGSEKFTKKKIAGRERTKLRTILDQIIKSGDFDGDLASELNHILEKWDEWSTARDGKSYVEKKDWELIKKLYKQRCGKELNWKHFMSK